MPIRLEIEVLLNEKLYKYVPAFELPENFVDEMRQFTRSMIVLLIDFDQEENRFIFVQGRIPGDLIERVFILGVQSNPEMLRRVTNNTFEGIGEALAEDCVNKTTELWGHDLLKHNTTELDRMKLSVRPFLFVEI